MSRERDQVLGHAHESDGIEEYDNPLPDWWLGIFLFSIVWAIGYTIEYHFVSDRSHEAAYLAELELAEARWPASERQVALAMTDDAVKAGAAVYTANCVACHGAALEGGIGPNLVDADWIHGGSPEDVARVITEGVPEKGMLTWGPILGPEKIAQVTAYVLQQGADGGAQAAP